jgi:multiple sugar transport system ATP-binding protein
VILPAAEKVASGDVIGLKLDPTRLNWLSPDSGEAFQPAAA